MKYLVGPFLLSLILVVAIALPVGAKDQKQWRGYLIDRMCMKAVAASPDPFDFVRHHTKDCVLMPACRKAGFALFIPESQKWLNLDLQGNKLAEKVIRKSKRNSAFYATVTGRQEKSIIKTEKIEENFQLPSESTKEPVKTTEYRSKG